ncbi:MAG: 16S rRNA (guanine(966)-N(2))-methyltransferase RsmD [Clostridiales bacterium]|jgi:16S rRNA (guanine(966)-N(2))-methyltransferase RsmD|nr:16S rRNA (guanine(966)-N(2))-methyltransferase RsmD [Clostridiales bacterium]
MRVISGKYKGRRLTAPPGLAVRPTADRVKETMFNILKSRAAVADKDVLDIFCGSGALGLEALSCGAKSAVFVDSSAKSLEFTRKNLKNIAEPFGLIDADFRRAVKSLRGRVFGLILADPPYNADFYGLLLDGIAEYGLLAGDGVLVIEHNNQNSLQDYAKSYIIDTRVCGKTAVSFLTRRSDL